MPDIDIEMVIAAFGCGIFASALGIIGSFSFSGFIVLLGVVLTICGYPEFQAVVAFGPCFGPHVFFASAVAATAYAARKGDLLDGCEDMLLDGCNDVLVPMNRFKRVDILIVGGVFGIVAHIVQTLLSQTAITVDTVAFTVVISNLIVRVAIGRSGIKGFFGKSPKAIKVFSFESKLPYHLLLGFSVGILSSYLTQVTGSAVIGFGISAVTLIFLFHSEVPVTHHISICAAYATVATGNILVGGLFGALACVIGIMFINIFNKNADTYMDFPALTIASLSAIIFTFM